MVFPLIVVIGTIVRLNSYIVHYCNNVTSVLSVTVVIADGPRI